jgi:hypothetical protein
MKNQTGFTLMELMMVLAGAAALAIGTWTFASLGTTSADLAHDQAQVTDLTQTIVAMYVSRADFRQLSDASAEAEGWLPASIARAPSGAPVNPWGGIYTLGPAGSGFMIAQSGVPADACEQLMASVGTQAFSVSVNGTQVANGEAATAACQLDSNSVELDYAR